MALCGVDLGILQGTKLTHNIYTWLSTRYGVVATEAGSPSQGGVALFWRERARVGGEVQGKADVPALYTLNSSILLEFPKSVALGLFLQSCTRERAIEHNNVAYSDDTDGHVSVNHYSESPMESVI